jgi:hypothetical protein
MLHSVICALSLGLVTSRVGAVEVSSNSVVFKDTTYELATNSAHEIVLVSKHKGESITRQIELKGIELSKDSKLKSLKLAIWNNTALIAVATSRIAESSDVFLLVFPKDLGVKTQIAVVAKRIHASSKPTTVLAFNGEFEGDGILVILGVFMLNKHGVRIVESGAIYLDDCPAPDAILGTTSSWSETKATNIYDERIFGGR